MTDHVWSGRFERGPHPEMVALTSSIEVDIRLLEQDALATKAHARVLLAAGLLEQGDVARIDRALDDLVEAKDRGELVPDVTDEDVHSLVERRLTEALGETGRRIHAGRSRNDLVAADLRLFCRDAAAEMVDALRGLIEKICEFADGQAETVMPAYTHLQRAQPVSMGFHMLAHGFSFLRDATRFRHAYEAADVSALGAGAVAGNTLGLDPEIAAAELRFSEMFDNAMDAVSDRDFVCDLAYAAALCAVHLSRLAEEIVLWTSSEFGFARLSDEWSTGSSMMPQKRNPDLAELVRGRAAAQIADLTGLLSLIKGLPLAYDRDLQEDKEYLFRGFDRAIGSVRGMTGLLGGIRFDKERMARAATEGAAWATDLAEALVARGVPFREAHEATGGLVAEIETEDKGLADLSVDALKKHHSHFAESDLGFADPRRSLAARSSRGGTAPERVAEQATRLRAAAEHLGS